MLYLDGATPIGDYSSATATVVNAYFSLVTAATAKPAEGAHSIGVWWQTGSGQSMGGQAGLQGMLVA
jgi:hypothetical protein